MIKMPQKSAEEPLTLNIKDNINDIFMQKKAYQIHVKKLSQIRSMRKNNLQTNTNRNFQIQHIKDVKHKNFMYKLNQQASKIEDDNLKLFDKLNREMSASRSTNIKEPISMRARRSMDYTSMHQKIERQKMLDRQNKRLKQRIRSSQSYINNSKLMSQQKKRLQIRSRIRRFNANSQLKSQRYFSVMSARSEKEGNSFSCNLESNDRKNNQSQRGVFKSRTIHQEKAGKTKISSFYNPKQIIMNKIQNFGVNFKNWEDNGGSKARPITSESAGERKNRNKICLEKSQKRSFFATQAISNRK